MAKSKRKSKYEQSYQRERKRIQQFIRRAEKRGYIFEENILPDRPKKLTAQSVERLRKLTPEKLYKKSRKVDIETGEILSGPQGRKFEKSQSAKRSAQTRKQKREAEQRFFTSQEPIQSAEIPFATSQQQNTMRGQNLYNRIKDRLSIPIATIYETDVGQKRRRKAEVANSAEQARQRILNLLEQQYTAMGPESFGEKFNSMASDISDYLDALLFASTATQINYAYSGLVSILNDTEIVEGIEELEEYETVWVL